MTLPDFQILHRGNCYCAIGHVPDRLLNDECRACDEPFGFNIPIVRDEGRLTRHLSCAIESDIAESDRDLCRSTRGTMGCGMKTLYRFNSFSEAFAHCRAIDQPIAAIVVEACNDCCRETENAAANDGDPFKRVHKLYPSGRAIPLSVGAE